jgi:hypothetical protein
VGKEESLRDAVGIIIVINVFVMPAMLARPHENRVFKSSRAEDQGEESDGPSSLESDVREEPVITKANAESATEKHQGKKSKLKPVEPEMPEIEGNRRQRKRESADKKRTGRPVDAMNGKTGHHILDLERSAIAEAVGGAISIRRGCGASM